jgi:hypothetical protein
LFRPIEEEPVSELDSLAPLVSMMSKLLLGIVSMIGVTSINGVMVEVLSMVENFKDYDLG